MITDYNSFSVSYEDFKDKLNQVDDTRDAALFSTIYCGYARVGEIVKGRHNPNPPITKEQINVTENHLIISIKTEKSGKWRRVPTSRDFDGWLHDKIMAWYEQCDGQELFPFTTRWAQKLFEKWFGTQHIHLLRHWACTHVLQGKRTKERLQPQYVARLGGWKDFNSFYNTYSHFIVEDFIEQI